MFLNYIKRILVKKALKNSIRNVKADDLRSPVKTVGLLVDESCFLNVNYLIKEIVANGITESNIKVIAHRDILKKNEVYLHPTFGLNDVNFRGNVELQSVKEFVSEEFDLLINYYDVEKPVLLLLTNNSKAIFKVGFSSIDKRLNHLMITSNVENYKVFIHELFRYLKILNKI
ncbi:hypothetical protein FNW52_08600 [Flavobacterium sp. ZT3R18]|uniref:DUF6913 domain-containing protein n=1 Tax=Flavobacterium sp. ZT3R18 TaxID=2594429 RepID=UPI001179AC7D|nr:hypothetical protein [Flavobacterium sp. ZT3R18]TRX36074.1 hypothetical protein FNW52_08600 [Flavobacterium sp. ZT3R18]